MYVALYEGRTSMVWTFSQSLGILRGIYWYVAYRIPIIIYYVLHAMAMLASQMSINFNSSSSPTPLNNNQPIFCVSGYELADNGTNNGTDSETGSGEDGMGLAVIFAIWYAIKLG